MTNQEFSDTFTTLLNSNSEVAQFGDQDAPRDINLTEYEKSVFLSLAEEDILKSYFNRNLNPHDQGFDDTERRQIEYSSLVKVVDLKPLEEKKTTNSSSSTGTDITPTRRLLAAKPVLRASSDYTYTEGIEPGSDGYVHIIHEGNNGRTNLVADFDYDRYSAEVQTFETYDGELAKDFCNVIWGAQRLAEDNGLTGPFYCYAHYVSSGNQTGTRALVKLVDVSAATKFYIEGLNEQINLPFSFTGQLCGTLDDIAGDEVTLFACDYDGYRNIYIGTVWVPDEASVPSGVTLVSGIRHDFWQQSHQDTVKHGYYFVDTQSLYFDKSSSGYRSGTKYIAYQIYTGYGSVGPIEAKTDAKWLSLYWGRDWANRTSITVDLDAKNGTNNTGKPREAKVYVTWWYYNQDGTSTEVKRTVYVFQGTSDSLSPDLGFTITPDYVNMGGTTPYDGSFTYGTYYDVWVDYESGCTYSVELENPDDTWIHFRKGSGNAEKNLEISCDANTTGSTREGRIAVTATNGEQSVTKYVTVNQPVTDMTPPEIRLINSSDRIVLDSESGSSFKFTVNVLNVTGIYTLDEQETDTTWLLITNNRNVGGTSGEITVTARSANESTQSRITTFKIVGTGTGGTTERTITVEQVAGFKDVPHISATPDKVVLPSTYIAGTSQKQQVVIDLTSGAHWNYSIANSANNNFFAVTGSGNKLTVYLTRSNTGSAIKSGSFIIFLSDSDGNALDLSNPAYYTTVQVIQQAGTSSGDDTSGGSTTSLPPTISVSPTTITAGVNGGTFVFDKFWYNNGELQKPQYDWGEGNTNDWFLLAYEQGRITGSPSSLSTYNQVGAVLYVFQNLSNTERVGTVKVTVAGPSGRTETQAITIRQDAAEIQPDPVDPDPEYPVPVITCGDTLNVPASGYDGIAEDAKVKVFLPITLENADDYEVSVVATGNIISKVNKYDDGISVWCNENTGNARTASLKITAKNGYSSAEKTVTVRQAGEEDTQPVPQWYAKLDKDSFVIKSVPDADDLVTVNIDSNISDISFNEVSYHDSRGNRDDWLRLIDYVDSRFEFSAEDFPNTDSADSNATIWWDTYAGEGEEGNIYAEVRQLAKVEISFSSDKYDASYSGGLLTLPFTTVGIAPTALKIINSTVGYATYTLTPSSVIVNISENTSTEKRSMQFTLTGTNELGEEASATVVIIQSVAPSYSGDDEPSGGGDSGEGGGSGSGSSGSQTPEYDDQTYTLSKFDDRSLVFRLPRRTVNGKEQVGTTDVLFILNEKLIVPSETKGKSATDYTIKPISYLEYDRIMSRAYNYPMKRQAWRLFQNQTTGFDIISEIIPANAAASVEGIVYRLRYVRRPKPIVLTDLPDGLTIDGYNTVTTCELNPMLHMDVVVRAVQLALASRSRQFMASNNEQK